MRSLLVLAFVLCALPAHAQVVFDANASASCTSNAVLGTTGKTCATLTVGAGANRAVVCAINWSIAVSSVAVTWDSGGTNQAMALITGATATNTQFANLWGLVAPTSGAKTVNVTWNAVNADIIINCTSWTGVDQTGGATSFPHGTGSAPATAATHSVVITSAVNNATMATTATSGTPSSPTQTQTFLNSTPTNVSGAGSRAAGAATVTHQWTYTTPNTTAIVGTDILAGGGAATPGCKNGLLLLGAGCEDVQ